MKNRDQFNEIKEINQEKSLEQALVNSHTMFKIMTNIPPIHVSNKPKPTRPYNRQTGDFFNMYGKIVNELNGVNTKKRKIVNELNNEPKSESQTKRNKK